jgi:hypothetical protein
MFAVTEAEIVAVESGRATAPHCWRDQLIAVAQDTALRALEAANNLLWREASKETPLLYAPPRLA